MAKATFWPHAVVTPIRKLETKSELSNCRTIPPTSHKIEINYETPEEALILNPDLCLVSNV